MKAKLKYIASLSILAVIAVIILTVCRMYLSENLSTQENLVKHLITEHSQSENSFSLNFLFKTGSTADIVYLSQLEENSSVLSQTETQVSINTKNNTEYVHSLQNKFTNELPSIVSFGFTTPPVKPPSC